MKYLQEYTDLFLSHDLITSQDKRWAAFDIFFIIEL